MGIVVCPKPATEKPVFSPVPQKSNLKLKGESEMIEEKKRDNVIERMGIDDSKTATRLLNKQFSPLIVRKYQVKNWPMYIGLIVDISLSDLDEVVYRILDNCEKNDMFKEDIQAIRNVCGYLSDEITNYYNSIKKGCMEGVAVLWYTDKNFVSSLTGDFMTHLSCKMELYSIINTLPHI